MFMSRGTRDYPCRVSTLNIQRSPGGVLTRFQLVETNCIVGTNRKKGRDSEKDEGGTKKEPCEKLFSGNILINRVPGVDP